MRARSLKPGICTNELLGTADPYYSLLFERLWMMADREGRLEDRPLRIKAEAFPYRDGLDVEPMLAWLAEHEFIVRYRVANARYIQVTKFAEHQRPHANERASIIPAALEDDPPETINTTKAVRCTTNSSSKHNQGSADDALTPDSGLLTPHSLTGDVPRMRATPPDRPRKKPKTALPEGFALDGELTAYATERMPDVDVAALFEGFVGKARAKSWVYADWRQAWQEFCRNSAPNSGHWASGQYPRRTTLRRLRTADEIEAEEASRGYQPAA